MVPAVHELLHDQYLGDVVGEWVGCSVGNLVSGLSVGDIEGFGMDIVSVNGLDDWLVIWLDESWILVGAIDGLEDGNLVDEWVGWLVGDLVGWRVGYSVGDMDGLSDGDFVGECVGCSVGDGVGSLDGEFEGPVMEKEWVL